MSSSELVRAPLPLPARALAGRAPAPLPGAFAACASGPRVLRAILQPGTGIATWRRDLAPDVRQAMAALHVLMPLHRMFMLAPGEPAPAALDRALAGFPRLPVPCADAWRDDLLGLVALARGLAPRAPVRVRLETKANDGCRLFHADNVPLRLICTYRGRGTQWLPDGAVDRAGLGHGSNDRVVRDWPALRELATGDVAVMKGLRFPGPCADALVHRSPPTDPALPRVVAVIDVLL